MDVVTTTIAIVDAVATNYYVPRNYLSLKGGKNMQENRGCGCGFGFGDDCCWIIIVLIILFCCCGGCGRGC